MRDSIQSIDNQRTLYEQLYAYSYEKKALADSIAYVQQQAEAELTYQTKLLRRNYLLYGSIGLAMLGFLFLRYRQKRKSRERALRLQQQEAEATRLRELDEFKSRLYTNITHEFRTPLTIIKGMAEEAKGSFSEQDQAGFDNALESIQRNGVSLLHLVNQMLDLNRLESGQMQFRLVHADVVPFLSYVCESFQSLADGKQIDLRLHKPEGPIFMDYDADKLLSIVSNLISNAIKFTAAGGSIQFRIQQMEQQLHIQVQDNGTGISAEQQAHVFDRFYSWSKEPNEQAQASSGIGLALVKELVDAMDGSIKLESELGKGSTFTIMLPVRSEADQQEAFYAEESIDRYLQAFVHPITNETKPDTTEAHLPLALIVEDNTDVQQYLKLCLQSSYRLVFANDGQQGIDTALEEIPDIIISDVMMSKKDGYALCHELKMDVRTSHIPIILLTAKASASDRISGLQKGADAYLTKPFDKVELLVRCEQLIALRRKLQERYRFGELPDEGKSINAEIDIATEDQFIVSLKEAILQRLNDSSLNVQDLCQVAGMSRTQLHRKLKSLTGLSTTHFVRNIRLAEAKKLLVDPNYNISEVAYDCGFSDPAYFSRVFSKEFGVSPSQYLQNQV